MRYSSLRFEYYSEMYKLYMYLLDRYKDFIMRIIIIRRKLGYRNNGLMKVFFELNETGFCDMIFNSFLLKLF